MIIRAINNISIISLIISYFIFFKFFSAINNCSVEFEEIYQLKLKDTFDRQQR